MKGPGLERESVCAWMARGEGLKLVTETDNIAAQVHYHHESSPASGWAGPAL